MKVPVTVNGWKVWRRQRDIERIKCKKFSEYEHEDVENGNALNVDIISDASAMCVICLDQYEADSMVIHLKCAHHFHKECGLPWLVEHEECPICRQCYKDAEDRHVHSVEMKKIGLESVNADSLTCS